MKGKDAPAGYVRDLRHIQNAVNRVTSFRLDDADDALRTTSKAPAWGWWSGWHHAFTARYTSREIDREFVRSLARIVDLLEPYDADKRALGAIMAYALAEFAQVRLSTALWEEVEEALKPTRFDF